MPGRCAPGHRGAGTPALLSGAAPDNNAVSAETPPAGTPASVAPLTRAPFGGQPSRVV